MNFGQSPLKTRKDLHLARKLWHALGVFTIIGLYIYSSRPQALRLAVLGAFLALTIDFLRHQWPGLNRIMIHLFRPVMRQQEQTGYAGISYLMVGVLVLVALFPQPIVLLSLLFLAIADPLASYVGLLYGKDKILGSKSLQGTMAAFLACTLISVIFFYWNNLMLERLMVVSFLAGLIGALAELVPIGRLDDNFTFPLVSAVLLWLLFFVFGGF